MAAGTPRQGRTGKPVGGGDGEVAGPGLRGTLRWDLFEQGIGDGLCDANHAGVIETHDGAKVEFSTLGYYRQLDEAQPRRWRLQAGLRFLTSDPRYGWLNNLPALLEGEFDMNTGVTVAQAYSRMGQEAS